MTRPRFIYAPLALCVAGLATPVMAVDFATQIRPIFEARCADCHTGRKAKSSYRWDTRGEALAGGESGVAIIPGEPDQSPLIKRVESDPQLAPMPPKGDRLSPEQVRALREWIREGAAWAESEAGPAGIAGNAEGAPQPHWSWSPLNRPPTPQIDSSWIRNPIDAFVLARLRESGLEPSPEADRRTLIRRSTFDLHGLPPTPEEIETFVNDASPNAYERLLDRLLASPRYGERWGRRWLDVSHYGETHGFDKDKRRPNAWPYRDYVIDAFNADKPWGRFIREQIAGDVLYPEDPAATVATGFLAAGPWDFVGHAELREGTVEKDRVRALDRDDFVATTITSYMSLTVHCARCHDHKFDPISQREYYSLQAVFSGIDRGDRAYETPDARRRREFVMAVAGSKDLPRPPMVYAAISHAPRDIRVLKRGDTQSPGERPHAGALALVSTLDADFRIPPEAGEGRARAALADWIADERNMLTWRSITNRIWGWRFGVGLVDTPNDFGLHGSAPTHPDLLDWLACELRDSGGSIKHLHRLILTSATYRQASLARPEAEKIDSGARLLWRMARARLDAEAIRDAALMISGELNLAAGGPSFDLFAFTDDHSPRYDYEKPPASPESNRRSVYRTIVRSVPDPFMDSMDCADPNINMARRNETYTALQSLALLNDPFILARADALAARLEREAPDPAARPDRLFKLAFGRPATSEESVNIGAYAARHGWPAACRLIFNANEFLFVD